jgi:agmatine deiminase
VIPAIAPQDRTPPQDLDLIVPAEWAPRRALWTAWPSATDLWEDDLELARAEVAAMIEALGPAEGVRVLAHGEEAFASARAALPAHATVFDEAFGDIWLRDTGPIFARRQDGLVGLGFRFNGWGGKYALPYDDTVAARIAARAGASFVQADFILEGGAIDGDGEGTFLTTRQCLLNPNRNVGWTQAAAEAALRTHLGARKLIWLGDGLLNDHTDGHVDNIARFVGPGRVACQAPSGPDDPNSAILDAIARDLEGQTDAQGRRLEVIRIPSPGGVFDEVGEAIPASHMNFLIGAEAVVVPIYSEYGDDAVRALGPLFPGRRVVGLSAHAILTGGGSFHCITQQEPA